MMSWPGGKYTGSAQPDPNALFQQFQLQPGVAAPVSGVTVPPAASQFSTATQPQTQTQPSAAPAAMDNAVQMLLARAMSFPLATVLFQSLMGTQQPPQPAAPAMFPSLPVMQPASQSPSQSPLMQMMQQAFQAGASSAVAAQPHVSVPPPAAAPQHPPTPASSPATSSAVQLPPMDPSVAKEMLVQLVQQLQQAGQLPYDDTLQRLLQPNADITRVQVKKENADDKGPMCVISKTESCDERPPQPEVYMDVAAETGSVPTTSTQADVRQDIDSDVSEGDAELSDFVRERRSHSVRATKKRQAVGAETRQRNTPQIQQKSPSVVGRSSSAWETDSKLQKKCVVKLDKVAVNSRPAQLSRVDRLKNMKKFCVPTDILQSHASSESGQPAAAKEQVDHKFDPQEKVKTPVNLQQSSSSSARAGPKNIFSIFAQHVIGRGVQQDEPAPEVRPSDPLPASAGVLLQRSVNVAQNNSMSLRSMYLGYASHNMEWLSLVSGVFGSNRKTFCQCTFCPKLGEFPRDVAVHISSDHQDLLFALNKLKPVIGPLMYIKCRHCNFVTVESTVAWIHLDIHHGISDILDCSDLAADMDMSGPDMPSKFINIDDVMGSVTAYVCYDCSAVNADPDIQASSMLMARHVARQHPDSINCNGNFVKLMMLTRTPGDPDSIKGSPTYRQAMSDIEHSRGRREVYICMFCRYSAFSPYLALSHSISAHQKKSMLYICNNGDCDYQCVAEVDMMQHMKVEHSDHGNTIPLVSSATLVVKKSSGDGFVECPVLVKRTGNVEYVSNSQPKAKTRPSTAASKAKGSRRVVSSSSSSSDDEEEESDGDDSDDDDDDDDDDNDEITSRLRNHGKTAKSAKRLKTQREVSSVQTRGSLKTKTNNTAKRVRTDDNETDDELQNMTVTSSNDHSSATVTAAANVMTDQVDESTEETGALDEATERNNEDVAGEIEMEVGPRPDESTSEMPPAAVAAAPCSISSVHESVDEVSETTAPLDHDQTEETDAETVAADADETETEELGQTTAIAAAADDDDGDDDDDDDGGGGGGGGGDDDCTSNKSPASPAATAAAAASSLTPEHSACD